MTRVGGDFAPRPHLRTTLFNGLILVDNGYHKLYQRPHHPLQSLLKTFIPLPYIAGNDIMRCVY